MDADRLMGHSLPVSACIDEDAFFIGQDDHGTCLDTSTWDPGANDSSRVWIHLHGIQAQMIVAR